MDAIENLPNRPLRPEELQALKEHPKIDLSASFERSSMDSCEKKIPTMVMLMSGNAVALTLEENGWETVVMEKNISEREFIEKADGFAERF